MSSRPPADAGPLEECYRHPGRQTGVRCQRCERPVCAGCMVAAPAGVQCEECVRTARSRLTGGRPLLEGPLPYATYGLLGANLAVWLIGSALELGAAGTPVSAARLGGLYGPLVAAGQWWRIVTAGFLHSGLLHLAFNMAALFVFGPPLERSLGRIRFMLLYLTSLVAGSLGALLLSPTALTVGASGAIFGLFGAILVAQRRSGIPLRSGGMLPLLLFNLVFTLASPGISIGGHLGGLAGGLLAGWVLFRPGGLHGRAAGSIASAAFYLALVGVMFAGAVWVSGHPLR